MQPLFATLPDTREDRWRLIRELNLEWTGKAVDASDGFGVDSVEHGEANHAVRFPSALREWYQFFGRLPVWTANYFFLGPLDTQLKDDLLVFYDEEGKTWVAGIRRSDLQMEDPPVVVVTEGQRIVADDSVSTFAIHMFLHSLPDARGWANATVESSVVKLIENSYPRIPLADWSWMTGSRFVGTREIVIEFLWDNWISVHARKERTFRDFMDFVGERIDWNASSDEWPAGWVNASSDL